MNRAGRFDGTRESLNGVLDAIDGIVRTKSVSSAVSLGAGAVWVLRFLLLAFGSLALAAVAVAVAVNPIALVTAVIAGAAAVGLGAVLFFPGAELRSRKTPALNLMKLLRDSGTAARTAGGLLGSVRSDETNVYHRVYAACFLRFLSGLRPEDYDTRKEHVFNSPGFKCFMKMFDPVTRERGVRGALRERMDEVLNNFAETSVPTPDRDEQFATIFPFVGVPWYDVVKALAVRQQFYCCFLAGDDAYSTRAKQILDAETDRSWNIDRYMEWMHPGCGGGAERRREAAADCCHPYAKNKGRYRVIGRRYERGAPPEIEAPLFYTLAHGTAVKEIIRVPRNIVLIKSGIIGNVVQPLYGWETTAEGFRALCDKNTVQIASDVNDSGMEVVPPGGLYPNLSLSFFGGENTKHYKYGILACSSKAVREVGGFEGKKTTLDEALKVISESAGSYRVAVAVVDACQETGRGNLIAVGIENSERALADLPEKISLLRFGKPAEEFDVRYNVVRSWYLRANKKRQFDMTLFESLAKKKLEYLREIYPETFERARQEIEGRLILDPVEDQEARERKRERQAARLERRRRRREEEEEERRRRRMEEEEEGPDGIWAMRDEWEERARFYAEVGREMQAQVDRQSSRISSAVEEARRERRRDGGGPGGSARRGGLLAPAALGAALVVAAALLHPAA